MKCDRCENEATVHEWTKQNGQKHLCEECARTQGLAGKPSQQITEILAQLMGHPSLPGSEPASSDPSGAPGQPAGASAAKPSAEPAQACPTCGITYADFRQHGLLGCPECYTIFEGKLGPLLERAHEGGTHHMGKVPIVPAGGRPAAVPTVSAAELSKRLAALKKQLDDAVQAEQYERAAAIRDELARAEGREPTGGAAARSKPPADESQPRA